MIDDAGYTEAIAPYRSSFFGAVMRPELSPKTRLSLAAEFAGRMTAIDEARAKAVSDRQRNELERLRLDETRLQIEEAREEARRRRLAEADAARASVELDTLPDEPGEIRRWGLANAGTIAANQSLAFKWRLKTALPEPEKVKPLLTAEQMMQAGKYGVPRDVLERGDPYEIGTHMRKAEEPEKPELKPHEVDLLEKTTLPDPEEGVTLEQWSAYSALMNRFAEPAEQKKYDALKDTDPNAAALVAARVRDRVYRSMRPAVDKFAGLGI